MVEPEGPQVGDVMVMVGFGCEAKTGDLVMSLESWPRMFLVR